MTAEPLRMAESILSANPSLSRPEACEQRRRQHIDRHGFLDGRVDRPAPFTGILDETRVAREFGVLGEG